MGIFLYGIIYLVSKFIYKREVFGTGDIYALSIVGLSSDFITVFYIGLFSFVIAGIFYFVKFLFIRNFEKIKNEQIPFVPFILVSYLIFIYF